MVMPSVPFPEHGAEQIDRACGIRQLVRLGYDVRVISKTNEWHTPDFVSKVERLHDVTIIGVPYKYSNRRLTFKEKALKALKKCANPLYLDGAAFEYAEPEIQAVLQREVEEWKPDIVWFEYTYLWPLYHIPRAKHIRIVTRSANFEPQHFIEESGRSIMNGIKYVAKLIGERRTTRWSDLIFSITPREQAIYERLGARRVVNLPLRGLPPHITYRHDVRDRKPLKVFFMGSTYTVHHNKEALREVLVNIAPRLAMDDPGAYTFHIFGKKLPAEFNEYLTRTVQYAGFQEASNYLADMDVALIPSLYGAGMQQKIFEPLAMGIPVLTSKRGIAGYPFVEGESVLYGAHASDFVVQLISLKDVEYRKKLSRNSKEVSQRIFSGPVIDSIVAQALEALI
jgi:hypothetical protein